MCGKEAELYAALVEGTELSVCGNCCKFGKILRKIKIEEPKKKKKDKPIKKPEEPVIVQAIVEDYAQMIRKAREKLCLNQKDFARKISEKESLVHNFETGKIEPSLKIALKLEKMLGIKLIEEVEETEEKTSKIKPEGFTIGDIIKSKE